MGEWKERIKTGLGFIAYFSVLLLIIANEWYWILWAVMLLVFVNFLIGAYRTRNRTEIPDLSSYIFVLLTGAGKIFVKLSPVVLGLMILNLVYHKGLEPILSMLPDWWSIPAIGIPLFLFALTQWRLFAWIGGLAFIVYFVELLFKSTY